jgi:hypothetical protein
MALRSKQEFYALYKATVQGADTDHDKLSDWSEGSLNDMYAAAAATIAAELVSTIVSEFARTFIANAEGAEKDELIVDHFGESFERVGEQKAIGIAKFTRTSSVAALTIPKNTVVQTLPPVGGSEQSFLTVADVTFEIGVTVVYVAIEAQLAGPQGNVDSGEISVISPSISGVTVTNDAATSGGAAEQTDAEYQDYTGHLISALRGPTAPGIQAKLKTISGIEKATVHEKFQAVKNWNIASSTAEGSPYTIVVAKAYIADANGTANSALIEKAEAAVIEERAAGVNILIEAASAQSMNWAASFTLNASGPNFAALSLDASPILDTMREYINNLGIGDDFVRANANAHVLSKWGPTGGGGSNDITVFSTSTPSGDVATGTNVKLIAGTMSRV